MSHIEKYLARYAVLAIAVLTPVSTLLGQAAADLGGADTTAGRVALGAVSGIAVLITGFVFIQNLGKYQIVRDFGTLWEQVKNFTPTHELGESVAPPTRRTPQ